MKTLGNKCNFTWLQSSKAVFALLFLTTKNNIQRLPSQPKWPLALLSISALKITQTGQCQLHIPFEFKTESEWPCHSCNRRWCQQTWCTRGHREECKAKGMPTQRQGKGLKTICPQLWSQLPEGEAHTRNKAWAFWYLIENKLLVWGC